MYSEVYALTAPGFPEVHPVPVAPFPPPSSPSPLELLQELVQEIEAGVETGLLEGSVGLRELHHQIRREEHQSLDSLLSGLADRTPHLSTLHVDSQYGLVGARGLDDEGPPWYRYDEVEGSAHVWFYPHPIQDAPPPHALTPSDPAPPPAPPADLDPSASSSLLNGASGPFLDYSPLPSVQIIVIQGLLNESLPNGSLSH
ncbi:hypothetical protein EDC04DRAFT_2902795 [Pisolithus marmoratus]|nr:hypothetical protein EDC04DRAFT_2902795 [Pisolithus marmoratus]